MPAGTTAVVLPGLGVLAVGLDRLRDPEKEEWPAEYGLWTYGAGTFLLVSVAWLVFVLYVDYVAGG